jgi:hypothetical protein
VLISYSHYRNFSFIPIFLKDHICYYKEVSQALFFGVRLLNVRLLAIQNISLLSRRLAPRIVPAINIEKRPSLPIPTPELVWVMLGVRFFTYYD